MKGKEIKKALECCSRTNDMDCEKCPLLPQYGATCFETLPKAALAYVEQLKVGKQLAETQLKELLSALYQRTEKPFTLEQKDIVELAKDYGIREGELK